MERKFERIVVGFVAENNSGKSTLAQKIKLLAGWEHYSAREYIEARYKRIFGEKIQTKRDVFTTFSQNQKNQYGAQTFAVEIIKKFLGTSDQICIIESLRSPEETKWFKELTCWNGKNVKGMPINITAPVEQRKKFFLMGRPDELATEQTEAEFERQELLVNSGVNPWEENIKEAMKYSVATFANLEGKLEETAHGIISFFNQFLVTPVK